MTSTALREPTGAERRLGWRLAGAAVGWLTLYLVNERVWDWLFEDVLGLDLEQRAVGAAHFFLYDVSKIALLLLGLLFVVGLVNTTISPERVRDALAGRRLATGLVLAVVLGAVTPFCSCSSVPLFIGLVAAGVPLSITLAFLIASPLISETAIIMMGGTFGWGIAALWAALGGALALAVGAIISRFDLNRWVEPFVFEAATTRLAQAHFRPRLSERVEASWSETRQVISTIWRYVVGGIAVGAAIHGWVPDGFFNNVAGGDSPLAVMAATLLGVPLYANPAGVVPLADALHAKGTALGTTMAFTMSVVALSPPSLIMLRRVLKPPLLALFTAAVTVGIVTIGIVVNLLT